MSLKGGHPKPSIPWFLSMVNASRVTSACGVPRRTPLLKRSIHHTGWPRLSWSARAVTAVLILNGLAVALVDPVASDAHATVITFHVEGVRTETTYEPYSSRSSADSVAGREIRKLHCEVGVSGEPGCGTPIPANEWLWVKVQVESAAGEPARHTFVGVSAAYDRGYRYASEAGYTDANGSVQLLIPPTREPGAFLAVHVATLDARVYAEYLTRGSLPPDPREQFLTMDEAWAEYVIEVNQPGYAYWVVDAFQNEASEDTPGAFFFYYNATRDEKKHVSGHYTFRDRHGEVHVEAGTPAGAHEVELDLPPRRGLDGDSFQYQNQGLVEPGEFRLHVFHGRSGYAGDPDLGIRLFAENGTFSVRKVAEGDLRVHAGALASPFGAHVSSWGFGPEAGDHAATAEIASPSNSTVVAAVSAGMFNGGLGSIRHDSDRVQEQLSPGQLMLSLKSGDCSGDWDARFSSGTRLAKPLAVIVEASALTLPSWAKSLKRMPVEECEAKPPSSGVR